MKVILLEDVDNVGKKYEVKEVKNGFARNFLLAKSLAKPATKPNLKWLAGQKEIIEKEATEDLAKAQELASKVDDAEVVIAVKVNPEGQLFESITVAKISDKLKEMGFSVKKSQIKLDSPIKEQGEFSVKLALDHNLEAEVKVIVLANEKEAL